MIFDINILSVIFVGDYVLGVPFGVFNQVNACQEKRAENVKHSLSFSYRYVLNFRIVL